MHDRLKVGCFLCKVPFEFGPHLYEGRYFTSWGVSICHPCLDGNRDGVAPDLHPDLELHLLSRGVDVRHNGKGWIDIPV